MMNGRASRRWRGEIFWSRGLRNPRLQKPSFVSIRRLLHRLQQFAVWRDRSVQWNDAVDAQVATPDVLQQIRRKRRDGGAWIEDVRLNENSFLREISHQQRVCMRVAFDVFQIDGHRV